jgi:hypothetical protein
MKSIHGGSPELDAAFADIVAYYRGMPLATPQ